MAETTTLNLCILWEGELREAARLIHQAYDEKLPEAQRGDLMVRAMTAAATALWGLTDDHACVLVGSDEIRKIRKRKQLPTSEPGQGSDT